MLTIGQMSRVCGVSVKRFITMIKWPFETTENR